MSTAATPLLIFALHVIGYDIWFYISHLLLHTRLGWRFHKTHHEVTHPRFTDTYTGHPLEGPFQSLGFLFPLAFYSLHYPAAAAALLFVNARGLARHDDRTIWLIGNHHLLHHEDPRTNFGEYWLDRLCGTGTRDPTKILRGLIYV